MASSAAPTGPALREAKRAMRAAIMELRDALPADERAAASRAIAERVMALPAFAAASSVLVTLPFRSEWDSALVARAALASGKRVIVPRVEVAARMLTLHAIDSLDDGVAPGYRGIPEPRADAPQVAPRDIALALVPGVAFDAQGCRLGYGGGYYDRLLPLVAREVPRIAGASAAVLAPTIATAFGVEPRWIGLFIGIVYAGAMAASLASGGFIERFGSIRTSQACVLLCAAGVALIAVAPAQSPWLLALAALVIGTGYGPITPASSQLLARTTPRDRMGVTFSIKQTGVPAGVAVAGAVLPSLAHGAGWRWALGAIALTGVIVAVAAQPVQAKLDVDRQQGRGLSLRAVLAPLAHLRTRALRQTAMIGFAYSATQVCLTSFLVVYLTEALAYPLVGAGLALSVATVGGIAGRIGWGVVADRWLRARSTLAVIGALAAVCAVLLAVAQPAWPAGLCLALAAVFGATAIGWNGVQLAEVARLAPRGNAGAVTGAVSFVTFSGVVVGPPMFALLASLASSYRASFAALAVLSGTCAAWLVTVARRRGSE